MTTRTEAKQQGLPRYFGKVCAVHPGDKGERYVASYGCIKCVLDAVKRNQAANPELIRGRTKAYYAANKDEQRARTNAWLENNREYRAAQKRAHREANIERITAKYKEYYTANYPRMLAKRNKQNADKLQRTPAWLTEDDFWMIEQAYELAALRTKMFGFAWHVDHALPLRGKTVSGLHVPLNLQVIPGVDNLRKGNRI